MEYRKLGKTGMNVSVLGFGGWEIGYQHISLTTVKKLMNEALDAGINVIDTAECYATSEELIGEAVGKRRKDFLSPDEMRARKRLELSGLASRVAAQKHPAQSQTLKNRSFGSHPAPQLFRSRTSQGSRHRYPETRSRARLHALYRLQRRQPRQRYTPSNAESSIRCKHPSTSPIRKRSTSFCLWQRSAISGSSPNVLSLTLLGRTVIGRPLTPMAGPTGKGCKS